LLAYAIPAQQLRTYDGGCAGRETGNGLSKSLSGPSIAFKQAIVAAVLSQQQTQHLRGRGGHLGGHTKRSAGIGGDTPDVRELQVKGTLGARKLHASTRNLSIGPSSLRVASIDNGIVIGAAEGIQTINFSA
jgi:hypothetical protein